MWWKQLAAIGALGAIAAISLPLATLSIKVDLPPATPPAQARRAIELQMTSSARGVRLRLNDKPTTRDKLLLDMAEAHDCDAASTPVHITTDSVIKYGEFMALVDELQTGGYFKLTLVTHGTAAASK